MKLNYKRTILVGFAFFLISAFWQAYDAIVPLILSNHFGLPEVWSGAVMSIDNVLAVFMLPIFGALSDKVNTKYGKRTPFVFIGTVLAIVAFIGLIFIDSYQANIVMDTNLPSLYEAAVEARKAAYEQMTAARLDGDAGLIAAAEAAIDAAEVSFAEISAKTLEITMQNILPLIAFIGVLLLVLISMATFRSPAVALMPDVTVKPLRSKGNAIINLMGTAGGIIVLVLGMVFGTSKVYMQYIWYVVAVCAVMLVGLLIFLFTVKEVSPMMD